MKRLFIVKTVCHPYSGYPALGLKWDRMVPPQKLNAFLIFLFVVKTHLKKQKNPLFWPFWKLCNPPYFWNETTLLLKTVLIRRILRYCTECYSISFSAGVLHWSNSNQTVVSLLLLLLLLLLRFMWSKTTFPFILLMLSYKGAAIS